MTVDLDSITALCIASRGKKNNKNIAYLKKSLLMQIADIGMFRYTDKNLIIADKSRPLIAYITTVD